MAYVKIDGFMCEQCLHRWILKQPGLPEPKVCPKCRSCQWHTPRMRPPKADPYRNDPALAAVGRISRSLRRCRSIVAPS